MSDLLYQKAIPLPECLVMRFPMYKEISIVVEDVVSDKSKL